MREQRRLQHGRRPASLIGNGDGSFQPVISYAAGNGAQAVAVADLNGGETGLISS